MTHARITGVPSIATATDAWFRQYVNFSDFLTTAGFPKTADTGQVDWTTVTFPASGVFTNYEIRRFDDAYQSTSPIFMKIGYGYTTLSSVQYPRIQITLGTGSDGAGNLTGVLASAFTLSVAGSTTAREWLCGSDGSGFAVLGGPTTTIARCFFGVERGLDAAGDPLPGMVMVYYSNATAASYNTPTYNLPGVAVIDNVNGTTIASDTLPILYWKDLSLSTSTLVMGTYYPFGVITFPTRRGIVRNKLMIGAAYNDFSDQVLLDVPRFTGGGDIVYFLEKKEASTLGGAFGTAPSGVATTSSDSPSAFAMPCIYWQ